MVYAKSFAPHLPFLRRYARALTGAQRSGDRYIEAALRALADAPAELRREAEDNPRLALYRFFHSIWGSSGAMLVSPPEPDGEEEEKLAQLAPLPRQAFLLTAVEGFSREDAGRILDVGADNLDRLIDQAQRDIEAQLRTKVLIVEDEPVIAADLEALVTELGHTVTGIATTRDEARNLARSNPPGLVLCDIQLADNSSGIDAADDITGIFDVPVIFITAFPERLLTGERPEPTYLISKPFQDNMVKATMSQALFFHEGMSQRSLAS